MTSQKLPPIPNQEEIEHLEKITPHRTELNSDMTEFLKQWKAPGDGKISKLPEYAIIINKIKWEVHAVFSKEEEALKALESLNKESYTLIFVDYEGAITHEDPFVVRKSKSIIKNHPSILVKREVTSGKILDALADLIPSSIFKNK